MTKRDALVIGGGMAGLMAAKVLADQFEQVTILERDHLPDGPVQRPGALQALHAHPLQVRAQQILERLFPGLTADLLAHGAVQADSGSEFVWFQHGVTALRTPVGLPVLVAGRALLEWRMRVHLQRVANIRWRTGYRVTELLTASDRSMVTGVIVEPMDRSTSYRPLHADLVVDASGRGSRLPQWLESMGYGAVPVTELPVNAVHASREFRYHGPAPDWKLMLQVCEKPSTRVGLLTAVEGGRYVLTLHAMLGDSPGATEAEFAAFARSLPLPAFQEWFTHAEPVGEITIFRTASSLRRHYERMALFPAGLAVLGDAACSLNPRYGQGIAAAAIGAEALQQTLAETPDLNSFSRLFQSRLARAVDLPWQVSTMADFTFPGVQGQRHWVSGLLAGYGESVARLAATDAHALKGMLEVLHLLKGPQVLFQPRILKGTLTLPAKPARFARAAWQS